jgi:hypothetical protein
MPMRVCLWFVLLPVLPSLAFSQTAGTKPAFDLAAVYAHAGGRYPAMRASLRAGRFEVKTATLVDLIASAYGVPRDQVLGGPNWLDTDRFDVIARVAAQAFAADGPADAPVPASRTVRTGGS